MLEDWAPFSKKSDDRLIQFFLFVWPSVIQTVVHFFCTDTPKKFIQSCSCWAVLRALYTALTTRFPALSERLTPSTVGQQLTFSSFTHRYVRGSLDYGVWLAWCPLPLLSRTPGIILGVNPLICTVLSQHTLITNHVSNSTIWSFSRIRIMETKNIYNFVSCRIC